MNEIISFVPYRPLFQMTPANWKPIVYIAIILAVKYLQDTIYWNKDIVEHTMLFELHETNKFEHLFLDVIDFNINVEQQISD